MSAHAKSSAPDFEDGLADFLREEQGTWQVESGRYAVTPMPDGDGVSTLRIEEPLPADLEFWATINANAAASGRLSNAFVILDYQSPTDFKFAGACVGSDDWVVGRRTTSGWQFDAVVSAPIQAVADYRLQVIVEGDDQVTLMVDGVERVTHQFADPVTDGAVGLGTWDALSRFDDVLVQQYVPPPPPPSTTLPVEEDFEDGLADFFQVEGIVLGISPTIQQMLRSKEGWPARYTESRVNVEIAETKKMVKAMTYMVTPEFQLPLDLPVASPYRQLILEGAAMWQFSPQYQRQLRRVLRPMERSQLGV